MRFTNRSLRAALVAVPHWRTVSWSWHGTVYIWWPSLVPWYSIVRAYGGFAHATMSVLHADVGNAGYSFCPWPQALMPRAHRWVR